MRLLSAGMQTVEALVSFSCENGSGGSVSFADSSKGHLSRHGTDQTSWDLLQ